MKKILITVTSLILGTSNLFAANSTQNGTWGDQVTNNVGQVTSIATTSFVTLQYVIMAIGVIMLALGIHETFLKEDRGGEGQKTKGMLKLIGGILMVAIAGIISFAMSFNGTAIVSPT